MSAPDLEWYEENDGTWKCLDTNGCVVGEVRYAAEGEAEGGLGTLVRFMVGMLRPHVEHPSLPPAGYYWTATYKRGVWTRACLAKGCEDAKTQVEWTLRTRFAGEVCEA